MSTKLDFSYGIIPIKKDEQNEWQFLIVQHNEGHWGFPKGHKEGKESDLESAQREFQEETGVKKFKIFPEIFFQEKYFFPREGITCEKKVKYFLAEVKDDSISLQKKELKNYRWLNYKQALNLITYPQSKEIIQQVYKLLYLKQ